MIVARSEEGGYVDDEETGLYYLRSRYYAAEWSRFLNADALVANILQFGALNLFGYCKNQSINKQDPTGYSETVDETVGILSIFSHHDHSWITYTPNGDVTTTYGTWGNKDPMGLYQNLEATAVQQGGYTGRVSLSVSITQEQEDALMAYISEHNQWGYLDNCSSFAVGAWKAAGQGSLSNKGFLWIPTPAALARSIARQSGYEKDAPIGTTGATGKDAKSSTSNPASSFYDSSYFGYSSNPMGDSRDPVIDYAHFSY